MVREGARGRPAVHPIPLSPFFARYIGMPASYDTLAVVKVKIVVKKRVEKGPLSYMHPPVQNYCTQIGLPLEPWHQNLARFRHVAPRFLLVKPTEGQLGQDSVARFYWVLSTSSA